jgi:hypothetical protein
VSGSGAVARRAAAAVGTGCTTSALVVADGREALGGNLGNPLQLPREVTRVADDALALSPDAVGVEIEVVDATLGVRDDLSGVGVGLATVVGSLVLRFRQRLRRLLLGRLNRMLRTAPSICSASVRALPTICVAVWCDCCSTAETSSPTWASAIWTASSLLGFSCSSWIRRCNCATYPSTCSRS